MAPNIRSSSSESYATLEALVNVRYRNRNTQTTLYMRLRLLGNTAMLSTPEVPTTTGCERTSKTIILMIFILILKVIIVFLIDSDKVILKICHNTQNDKNFVDMTYHIMS